MVKLVHEDGRTLLRHPFYYYAGKKYGHLSYWPEMLDDLRNGFTYETISLKKDKNEELLQN